MKRKNTLIILVFIIVYSIMFLFPTACSKEKTREQTFEKKAVTVIVQTVKVGAITRTLDYNGTVFPWEQANIAPEFSGRVLKIYKKQGDLVNKGDLLAELDTTSLRLQLKQAQAVLDAANAAYKDAELNFQRLQKLFEKNAVSKIQLEKAQLNLESVFTQEKSAEATLDVIKFNLDNFYLRAPFQGVVTSKNAEEGDVINPMMGMNGSVLTVMNIRKVKVIIDVRPEDVEKITLHQPAQVRVASLENESFQGSVFSKNLAADPLSKTFKVEIVIDNPQMKIKSGIFADVSIEISRKENCLLLPLHALIEEENSRYVVVVENGKSKFYPVTIGERNNEVVEILQGLTEGQLAVVEGNFDLKEGALITYEGAIR